LSRLALLAWVLGLAACGVGRILQPTPAQLARSQATWPDATPQTLDDGRTLFASRCTGCHVAPRAEVVPAIGWPGEVSKMAPRAHLTPEQIDLISRYLQTVSQP
jgi:mono/diheme cytochrome c family protein